MRGGRSPAASVSTAADPPARALACRPGDRRAPSSAEQRSPKHANRHGSGAARRTRLSARSAPPIAPARGVRGRRRSGRRATGDARVARTRCVASRCVVLCCMVCVVWYACVRVLRAWMLARTHARTHARKQLFLSLDGRTDGRTACGATVLCTMHRPPRPPTPQSVPRRYVRPTRLRRPLPLPFPCQQAASQPAGSAGDPPPHPPPTAPSGASLPHVTCRMRAWYYAPRPRRSRRLIRPAQP